MRAGIIACTLAMESVSHAPVEVAQLVIGYLRSFRSIAYLNKAWHAAACGLADLLYERFLDSKFSVDMLYGVSTGCPCTHPRTHGPTDPRTHRPTDRVNRKLQAVGVKNVDIGRCCWYTAQLYFHRFCGANVNLRLGGGRGFRLRDILLHCGRNSDIGKSYNFRQLLAEPKWITDDTFDIPGGCVTRGMFAKKRFVKTRDLGCPLLGYTVREVFRTIQCMIWGETYCKVFCKCKARPSASEVDSDERLALLFPEGYTVVTFQDAVSDECSYSVPACSVQCSYKLAGERAGHTA